MITYYVSLCNLQNLTTPEIKDYCIKYYLRKWKYPNFVLNVFN